MDPRPTLRVLAVDDEPLILRAFTRELRAYADRWKVTTVESGARALELLSAETFDILITDMVMPGIDGAAVLRHVRAHHPGMVRIVVSAHAEYEQDLRSVPFAHQRLLKPWNKDEMIVALERASQLHWLVGDQLIRRCISHLNTLPSSRDVYLQLGEALDQQNATFASIAAVISMDMAMSARLLQLANSAFVGARRQVTQLEEAARIVGMRAIREYFASPHLDVFEMFSAGDIAAGGRFSALGGHAKRAAQLASALTADPGLRARAYVTTLLHDIGSLVLLSRVPDAAREIAEEAARLDCETFELEVRRFGVSHAEIGAYLLSIWGIPNEVCDAVSAHHAPARDTDSELIRVLRVANWLEREHTARRARNLVDPGVLALDHDPSIVSAMKNTNVEQLLALADSVISTQGAALGR